MPTTEELTEQIVASDAMVDVLTERLADLELALDDLESGPWTRLDLSQFDNLDFSPQARVQIRQLSRYSYLKNPLINRGVNIQASYVFGQGLSIRARDEQVDALIQTHLDDRANQDELYSHQARIQKEIDLQVEGEQYFVFFPDYSAGTVRIRTVPTDQIVDIITNPEDSKDPWWYKRIWAERDVNGKATTKTVYYPDWGAPKDAERPVVASAEEIVDTPVYHVKVGGLGHMRFGVPEVYQALDWSRAYTQFLEDRATVARALAKFVYTLKSGGGKSGVQQARAKINTTMGLGSIETNPPGPAGGVFVAPIKDGATLEPNKVAGATIDPNEGRRFLLMVAAALGLPETFFGDVSVGTLATATSLDRPTELKFLDRRALWRDVHARILDYVLDVAGVADTADRHLEIDFPALLEHDPEQRVASIIAAATLGGKPDAGILDYKLLVTLLLQALDVDDLDDIVPALVKAHEKAAAKAEADAKTAAKLAAQQAKVAQAQIPPAQDGAAQMPTEPTQPTTSMPPQDGRAHAAQVETREAKRKTEPPKWLKDQVKKSAGLLTENAEARRKRLLDSVDG